MLFNYWVDYFIDLCLEFEEMFVGVGVLVVEYCIIDVIWLLLYFGFFDFFRGCELLVLFDWCMW